MSRIAIFVLVAVSACGGGSGIATRVTGSVGDLRIATVADVASSAIKSTNCGQLDHLSIIISDTPLVCLAERLSAGGQPARAVSIGINILTLTPQPGTYSVGSTASPGAVGFAQVNIAREGDTTFAMAGAGSVIIKAIDGDAISGEFSATDFRTLADTRDPSFAPTSAPGALQGTFAGAPCHLDGPTCVSPGTP